MNESWTRAKARYESEGAPPPALDFAVASAVRAGERRRRSRRAVRRSLTAAAACCAEHDAQCQQHAYHSFRKITFTHIVYSVCQCLGL